MIKWLHSTFLLILALLLASGCAKPTLVQPDKGALEVAETYRVDPVIEWSRWPRDNQEIWTVDGVRLQQLSFYKPRNDGDILFADRETPQVPAHEREHWPRFYTDMMPHDVAELVAASLAQQGVLNVQTMNLRPADFAGQRGFRFELAFLTPSNLLYRGLAAGHIDDSGQLYLVVYLGTAAHYYEDYRDDVESLLDTLQIL